MKPYSPHLRKLFLKFCLKNFYLPTLWPKGRAQTRPKEAAKCAIQTWRTSFSAPNRRPAATGGVRLASVRRGGVTVTRVEVARDGLARPRGRYVTLETPSLHLLDERDVSLIETAAAELAALLPPAGPVLVLGVGNRRVTADALGPRTVPAHPGHDGPRPARCGASGRWRRWRRGYPRRRASACRLWPRPWWKRCGPRPLLCVDSLCTAEPERLGRTIQLSDTGLAPAQPRSGPPPGRRRAGPAGRRGGHPHPDGGRRRPGPGGRAPRAGQRHRPRGGPAGGRHQPGPAAPSGPSISCAGWPASDIDPPRPRIQMVCITTGKGAGGCSRSTGRQSQAGPARGQAGRPWLRRR